MAKTVFSAPAPLQRDSARTQPPRPLRRALRRNRPALMALGILVLMLIINLALQGTKPSVFEMTTLVNGGAALAIAAVGETLVILTGGFDLSAGAVLSFLNVVLAAHAGASTGSALGMCAVILLLGALTGLINGLLVAYLRIQPIIATLAASFVWSGAALLVMNQPGGQVPMVLVTLGTGDVAGVIPNALLLLIVVAALWLVLKNSRLGTNIYAVGSDRGAAVLSGIPVRRTLLAAYTLAGFFYGLAGLYLSAQTGSGDPNIGQPLLLEIFAAVIVGGTIFGGGRGGAVGSLFGAYVLSLIVNVLFVLKVSDFYTNICEGIVLILAVLATTLGGGTERRGLVRELRRRVRMVVS